MSASAPAPRAQRGILACAGGTLAPRAPPAPSRRVHRARARARVRLEGLSVPHTARHGAARPPRGRSTCAPGREEGLYVVQRPTRSRPACSARAWSACSGTPLGPRGWYAADSSGRPGVVGAEALRRAWVALLRARGISAGYQGGWNARSLTRRPPPNLPPVAGFGAWRGVRRSGPHSEVRDILISILGHSGPSLYGFGASRVSIDRLAEAPLLCAPAAVSPPQCEERSDQIGGTGVTCGPRRPKRLVMGSQGHGDNPAAASRRRTPSYKYTSPALIS